MITIEAARVNAGLTQEEVAKKLNWSKKTYIDYELYRIFFRVNKAFEFSSIVNQPLDNIIFLPSDYTSSVTSGEEFEVAR